MNVVLVFILIIFHSNNITIFGAFVLKGKLCVYPEVFTSNTFNLATTELVTSIHKNDIVSGPLVFYTLFWFMTFWGMWN